MEEVKKALKDGADVNSRDVLVSKEEVIARLPQSDFELPIKVVKDWIEAQKI